VTHLQNQPGLSPTEIDDVAFFEANPDQWYRLRPASAAEVADKLGVEVGEASAISGTWYAVVVNQPDAAPENQPTARVFAVAEPLTFDLDDEEIARRVFSAVVGRQA
jgi:hypothetical protein